MTRGEGKVSDCRAFRKVRVVDDERDPPLLWFESQAVELRVVSSSEERKVVGGYVELVCLRSGERDLQGEAELTVKRERTRRETAIDWKAILPGDLLFFTAPFP